MAWTNQNSSYVRSIKPLATSLVCLLGLFVGIKSLAASEGNFSEGQTTTATAAAISIHTPSGTHESLTIDQTSAETFPKEGIRPERDLDQTPSHADADFSLNKRRIVTVEIRDREDQSISKVEETYTYFPWGERLTKRVDDPDGSASTEEWIYEPNPKALGYSCLIKWKDATGYSEEYSYDSLMRLTQTVRRYPETALPWQDAPSVANTKWKDGANSYWFKPDGTLVGGVGTGVGISWSQNGNTVTGIFVGGVDTGTVSAASMRIEWDPYTWKYASGPPPRKPAGESEMGPR